MALGGPNAPKQGETFATRTPEGDIGGRTRLPTYGWTSSILKGA